MNKIEDMCHRYNALKGSRGNWETHWEEILRIIAAQAAGAATGLEGTNPQFTGLDGTTIRIDGTYSGGTRSIDSLDGS